MPAACIRRLGAISGILDPAAAVHTEPSKNRDRRDQAEFSRGMEPGTAGLMGRKCLQTWHFP
jgi:hypothetical protein